MPSSSIESEIKADSNTKTKTCSATYRVPASANPYLAGNQTGSSIRYVFSGVQFLDRAPEQSPIELVDTQNCIVPSAIVRFAVTGAISNGKSSRESSADGDNQRMVSHINGATLGKSDIRAPINSLLGVFIGEGDPEFETAPSLSDFSQAAARNYLELRPKLRQVFFIGDGLTNEGRPQNIKVPEGAKRLYLGTMDAYEWKNNLGDLSCHLEGLVR